MKLKNHWLNEIKKGEMVVKRWKIPPDDIYKTIKSVIDKIYPANKQYIKIRSTYGVHLKLKDKDENKKPLVR